MDGATAGAHDHEQWVSFAQQAQEWVEHRQARLINDYGLLGSQYWYDLDEASIAWSRDGNVLASARITAIGSVHVEAQNWRWSWANVSLPAAVLGDIATVREYGELHRRPVLTTPSFDSFAEPVNQATCVALYLLDADGLWRATSD